MPDPKPTTAPFTPGPWRINPMGGQIIDASGLVSVCNTFERHYSTNPSAKWIAEHEANARLIAAAPTLLASLANIVECLTAAHDAGARIDTRDMWENLRQGRAAIAKATQPNPRLSEPRPFDVGQNKGE
jgi:hypothetical protein